MSKETSISGILMPLMKHSFRIVFGGEQFFDEQIILTQQVIKCSIDMSKKEFNISLRQPMVPNMFTILNIIIKGRYNIYVEPMDSGNDNGPFSVELHDCRCTDHKFDLDYAISGVATHELVFSYSELREIESVNWQELVDELKNPKK